MRGLRSSAGEEHVAARGRPGRERVAARDLRARDDRDAAAGHVDEREPARPVAGRVDRHREQAAVGRERGVPRLEPRARRGRDVAHRSARRVGEAHRAAVGVRAREHDAPARGPERAGVDVQVAQHAALPRIPDVEPVRGGEQQPVVDRPQRPPAPGRDGRRRHGHAVDGHLAHGAHDREARIDVHHPHAVGPDAGQEERRVPELAAHDQAVAAGEDPVRGVADVEQRLALVMDLPARDVDVPQLAVAGEVEVRPGGGLRRSAAARQQAQQKER